MEYYLMFHLDRDGRNGIVLYKNNDLIKMDNYIIRNFMTRDDAFKFYIQDISEFCLDNKDKIIGENLKNNHNRLGAITLFCKYPSNHGTRVIKIPIIYGYDKKLISNYQCLRKIKEKLKDDKVLKKIYAEKNYLLSLNERDTLKDYLGLHNEKNKERFIDYFTRRIKGFNDEKKYFFFRCLMKVCSLNELELNTRKGKVTLGSDIPLNTSIEKNNNHKEIKLESKIDDDYFNSLIESEDYEALNKYYDIEEIEKNSNIRNR